MPCESCEDTGGRHVEQWLTHRAQTGCAMMRTFLVVMRCGADRPVTRIRERESTHTSPLALAR